MSGQQSTHVVNPSLIFKDEGYREMTDEGFRALWDESQSELDDREMEDGLTVFQRALGILSFEGDEVIVHEWHDNSTPEMDGMYLTKMSPSEVVEQAELAWTTLPRVDSDGLIRGRINTDLTDGGPLEEFSFGTKYFLLMDPYLVEGRYRLRETY